MKMPLVVGVTMLVASLQTFKVRVDAVPVDVLVMMGGRPVEGLTAADFEVLDDGVPQQVAAISMEQVPLNVTLVLDMSESVRGTALGHLQEAADALVQFLTPVDRASILRFDGTVRLAAHATGDVETLRRAIATTTASGGTALHDATYAALLLRDERPGRSFVLVFSDGADTASWLPAESVIAAARKTEAVVYAATLDLPGVRPGYLADFQSGIQAPLKARPGSRPMKPFLDVIAEETGGKVVSVQQSRQLREAFVAIMKEFRSRYVLTYTPRGVASGGWHTLQVSVKKPGHSVIARRGYSRSTR